ncbi:hypothetical protein Avbf_07919, partial [Armadillidium vulgare]
MDPLVFYTSEYLLFRYGKIVRSADGFRVFVANLVVPLEPTTRFVNLDEILSRTFDNSFVGLRFVIENHKVLSFGILYENYTIPYLKKILSGEIRLRSNYFSDIFFFENLDNRNDFYDLVVYEEHNFDKLYIFPYNQNKKGHTIGYIYGQTRFLKEISCPYSNYKITLSLQL